MTEWSSQNAQFKGSKLKGLMNQNGCHQYNPPFVIREGAIYSHRVPPLLGASNGNMVPSLGDLEIICGGLVFPRQMSSECFYGVGPNFAGTMFNPTPANSSWTRHGEPVENNHTFNHDAHVSPFGAIPELDGFNKDFSGPMVNHKHISQNGAQILESKQMNRFNVGPENSQQQRLGNVLAPKVHLSGNVHYRDYVTLESQPNPKRRKMENAVSGPVRQVRFSGVVHYREYDDDKIQPTSKRKKMENIVDNDDWSLGFILGHHLKQQLSKAHKYTGRSILHRKHAYGDNKKAGNETSVLSNFEVITGVVEMKEIGCVDTGQVKRYDLGLNSDEKGDLAKSGCQSQRRPEDLKQSTLNEEIPSSISNIGESILCSNYAFDDKRLENENDVSRGEDTTAVVEVQETRCVDTCQLKSDGQSLNYDDKRDSAKSILSEELPNLNSEALNEDIFPYFDDIKSFEDLKQSTLSEEFPILDSDVWNEDIFPYFDDFQSFDDLTKSTLSEEIPNQCLNSDAKSDGQSRKKPEDLKVSGVSLIDFFTPDQIKEHLHSLNQRTHAGLTADTVDKNTCQLCDVGGLMFVPPPMHCTSCGVRIKHGLNYYRPPEDETSAKFNFCSLCFKVLRCGKITFNGFSFSKSKLEKCKYTDETPEGWVQCDKCEGWQHQICALYNAEQDLDGKSEYICPIFRLHGKESEVHASIPPTFEAKNLPRTKLSDHIEGRLLRSLEKERKQRAELLGKSPEEVPGAEGLVVRVVSAVDKRLKVKQQFLDILHDETYPTEFPFKSKVLLLFQKVDNVDVCIFAMYLQEFGSECKQPNNRSIYISYLDSVKYFKPEVKTVDGVALRTFVYHEILVGYLDYCKQQGFVTCYIWACPPTKADDYILYCHPKNQKTPNPHKLLQWYKKLLKKAKEEGVVVEYTNFYDHFFVQSENCNKKVTAARLPSFDGDYWTRAINDMMQNINKENKEAKLTKRALRAMGHNELSGDKTNDILVMKKLGQSILPSKEDFFVVHLKFSCVKCHEPILSGSRWSCKQCSKFHLCHRCFKHEPNSTRPRRTHTSINGETHQLFQIQVNGVAADTEDNDVILESGIFNDRESLLELCQEKHYQFNTLRHAKYSSMMILHHLQNQVLMREFKKDH